ncbi:succinate dehydrogenase iron-sulfur subunit [Acidihalobacter aeolianus]|uniref:Succinate dehydrogenase iron-sulfur subunit n=1 Tax=Acidihalobacter aeolianus TaxID=2792603 RepID=A0A1D8K7J2_9GAMM|nr:succinate dehydrogenase iron-sulfur subunit [Acidihalobacter aeolianus]AOV16934.1 succinate dehydrogenase iron-sulfur subunit [Acidihalobacter aeolianus]
MKFSIYRYDPEGESKPRMQDFELPDSEVEPGMMLLGALLKLKEQDETLSFRRSCQEGVCGSDGMNINGTNGLACITPLAKLKQPIEIRPLPGMPVVRDLVVDMGNFYKQYRAAEPYLKLTDPEPEVEFQQSPEERAKLDGLYECVLCGCCSAACPSYWWNPERFLGPAALLQSARFVLDSRDQATDERLTQLDDAYKLYRCHSIMNCVQVCPKGLNPTRAIGQLKHAMLKRSI